MNDATRMRAARREPADLPAGPTVRGDSPPRADHADPADPGADGAPFLRWVEALAVRRPPYLWAGRCALLHPLQGDHPALADRRAAWGGVCDADAGEVTPQRRR